MSDTPTDRLDRELGKLDELDDEDAADSIRTLADTLANQRKPQTITNYVRGCRLAAERGADLTSGDAEGINDLMAELHDGGDGLAVNTVISYQSAVRALYRHVGLGVDPEAIEVYTRDTTPAHDERDMFTEDEVFRMREAIGRTRDPKRNRAFLELLIFTLQRLQAILTLRVEDVDVEEGAIYLNAEYDRQHGGLKGALQRGRRRPVYGARKYLREWVEAHPYDEGYLFIGEPNHWRRGDGHWSETAARDLLERVGEMADVDKPVNPHAWRHYGITVTKRDYGDWDAINAQAGVKKGSNMPRETYNHVDDDDLMRSIEANMGLAEEQRNRFAPVVCPTCAEVLKSDWRKCPACDERFAPGEDDGREELEWLEDEAAVGPDAFERIVARAVDRIVGDDAQPDPS